MVFMTFLPYSITQLSLYHRLALLAHFVVLSETLCLNFILLSTKTGTIQYVAAHQR